jgi:hypothetical protein
MVDLAMFSHFIFHSGDTDAVVPITATRYSIDALKLPTLVNWYPWYDHGKVSYKSIDSIKQILEQNKYYKLILVANSSDVAGWRLESSL